MKLKPLRKDENGIQMIASIAAYNPEGKLLFGKRNDNQRYTLPGGQVEAGEHPIQAAVRELREEAGLRALKIEPMTDEVITTLTGKKIHVYAFKAMVDGTPTGKDDPDQECAIWFFMDTSRGLPPLMHMNLHSPQNVTLKHLGLQKWSPFDGVDTGPEQYVDIAPGDVMADAMEGRGKGSKQ